MQMIRQALKSFGNELRIGMFHTLGAEPLMSTRKGGLEMGFLGRRLTFRANELMPELGKRGSAPTSFMGNAFTALGVATTAVTLGVGYQQGGLLGAGRAAAWDFAVNAAMARHAYTATTIGGVTSYEAGRFAGSRLLSKFGKPGKIAAAGLNIGDVGMRYMWGTAIAGGFGAAMGGGFLGTIGAMAGGTLGVRYAGSLTVGAGIYYGGKLAAKGAYSVLKAGYNHTQMQKGIHTSGDMAAFMTQGAFSMRERAVQAMAKSHMNARSALGQEASYMHHPGRNYNSRYGRY